MSDHTENPTLLLDTVQQLIEIGARDGQISYDRINEALGDALLDDEIAEELFSSLEARGIKVVEGEPQTPKAAKTKAPKAKPTRADAELDDVLAKIESFFAPSETLPTPAPKAHRAEAATPGTTTDETNADELGSIPTMSGTVAAILDDEADETGLVVQDAFTQYLQQMGRIPLLSPEEEKRLATLAREGTPEEQAEAKQKLVEANLRLVVHIAKRYKGRAALPLLDVVQEGNLGLIRAVDRFDPNKGQRLSSFATWYIREAINRAVASQTRSIRLPGHLSELLQKVQRITRELTQSLGREPSRAEVARETGLTEKQIEELLRVVAEPLSLDQSVGGDDDAAELGEMLSGDDEDDAPISSVSRHELNSTLNQAMQTLSDREAEIMRQRFGLGEYEGKERTLDDIAKALGITRDRARQLEIRARRKLRRRLQGTPLGNALQGDDEDE